MRLFFVEVEGMGVFRDAKEVHYIEEIDGELPGAAEPSREGSGRSCWCSR